MPSTNVARRPDGHGILFFDANRMVQSRRELSAVVSPEDRGNTTGPSSVDVEVRVAWLMLHDYISQSHNTPQPDARFVARPISTPQKPRHAEAQAVLNRVDAYIKTITSSAQNRDVSDPSGHKKPSPVHTSQPSSARGSGSGGLLSSMKVGIVDAVSMSQQHTRVSCVLVFCGTHSS